MRGNIIIWNLTWRERGELTIWLMKQAVISIILSSLNSTVGTESGTQISGVHFFMIAHSLFALLAQICWLSWDLYWNLGVLETDKLWKSCCQGTISAFSSMYRLESLFIVCRLCHANHSDNTNLMLFTQLSVNIQTSYLYYIWCLILHAWWISSEYHAFEISLLTLIILSEHVCPVLSRKHHCIHGAFSLCQWYHQGKCSMEADSGYLNQMQWDPILWVIWQFSSA